jgi:hypothetical protein
VCAGEATGPLVGEGEVRVEHRLSELDGGDDDMVVVSLNIEDGAIDEGVGVEDRVVVEVVGVALVVYNACRGGEVEHGGRDAVGVRRNIEDRVDERLLVEDGSVIKVGETGGVDGFDVEVVGVEDGCLVDLNATRVPVEGRCPVGGILRSAHLKHLPDTQLHLPQGLEQDRPQLASMAGN